MKHTLRALRHRNFRLYYLGQLVSLNGTWMQSVAQAWLMYRLTESSFMLGLAGASVLLPNLLFGLYGGVLADRLPRRNLLIAAQALAMLQAFALGLLTLTGWVLPWHILVLAFFLGLVQAFEMPARHSLVAQLVPREDLPNAVALNSSLFQLTRFIGPAIAGVLVAAFGEGPVFVINGLTFIAVLLGLFAVRLPAKPIGQEESAGPGGVVAGLRYAWGHAEIRAALVLVALVSLTGASAGVLMPVFAVKVFNSGAESLGLLLGALGAGSLVGALRLARRRDSAGLERRVAGAALVAGVALVLFAAWDTLWHALLILPVVGFCITTIFASSNAFIQLTVPDRLRGRVMSIFTLALHGTMPLGHLAVGAAAEILGAPVTVVACGVLLFLAAATFFTWVHRAPHGPSPR